MPQSTDDDTFINAQFWSTIVAFRNYKFTPAYQAQTLNARLFLGTEWISVSELREFLDTNAEMISVGVGQDTFINTQPLSVIKGFRDFTFTAGYQLVNATKFLSNEWIDVSHLREYLQNRPPPTTPPIKSEPKPDQLPNSHVKQEPIDEEAPFASDKPTHSTRYNTLQEDGREVLEIVSSDDEEDEQRAPGCKETRPSPSTVSPDTASLSKQLHEGKSSLLPSDTFWGCADIKSEVHPFVSPENPLKVTQQGTVTRLECIKYLPPLWPVSEMPTAYLLDLSDPAYRLYQGQPVRTPNFLLKQYDNDSWTSQSGTEEKTSHPWVTFGPNESPIQCFRSRLKCNGVFRCEHIDPKILTDVKRRDLHPVSQSDIANAQINSRQADGATPESRAAIHAMVISSKTCSAVHPKTSKRCEGTPMVKPWTDDYGNLNYFIGCSGWRKKFKDGHLRESIPSRVDPGLLAKCLKHEKLAEGAAKDTPKCGTLLSPRIGRKKREC
ncbi:hypothetical protein V5O48_013553, partial [Marasmius crinis-equi]